MGLEFTLLKEDPVTGARLGRVTTPHGVVETPAFMPVGTRATVKTLSPEEVAAVGARIILANTYHLYLRPGHELIREAGGLHRFMNWSGPILTDSGGFQVFSLGHLCRVSEDGVLFRSHLDGSEHFFTPALVSAIQEALGSDIAMVLDECPPYPVEEERLRRAVERTTRWAQDFLAAHRRQDQAVFAIVQGGVVRGLREHSARSLVSLPFSGYAIGGLSVGEPKELMYATLEYTVPWLPARKPRYLMGVGSPDCLVEGVKRGVDLFDCVLPTRMARNGTVFTRQGRLTVRDAPYARDFGPLEEGCTCYACRCFSRAYIRHLIKAGEVLGIRLTTIHNLHHLLQLMEEMRQALAGGRFSAFVESLGADYCSR
ncbi:MAG: tRNA guanosine(34) transglycosylase Tgt [Peptococcaceae bacterium]|jgi:queuine tRNA-ribosyltransferase|nr:tRNA guanosine(34) transglycosylase Tgt [Peptococcaceae bacterium]